MYVTRATQTTRIFSDLPVGDSASVCYTFAATNAAELPARLAIQERIRGLYSYSHHALCRVRRDVGNAFSLVK